MSLETFWGKHYRFSNPGSIRDVCVTFCLVPSVSIFTSSKRSSSISSEAAVMAEAVGFLTNKDSTIN